MPQLSEALLIKGLQKEVELLVAQLRVVEDAFGLICKRPSGLSAESITQMQALDHAIQRTEDISSLLTALPDRLQWVPGEALSITQLYDVLKLKGQSFEIQNGASSADTALDMFEDDTSVSWL